MALHQFHYKAAVWANHQFQAYASAGVAWTHFSAADKEAFITPDAVTRLKMDWESRQRSCGVLLFTFTDRFRVLECQLEAHVLLSDEHIHNPYQLSLETNPEVSKALIGKLGSQPSASLNDIMEHVPQGDVMVNSKEQPTQVTWTRMDGKQREPVAEGATTGTVTMIEKWATQYTPTQTKSRSWLPGKRKKWLQTMAQRRKRNRKRRGAEVSVMVARKAATDAGVEENLSASI